MAPTLALSPSPALSLAPVPNTWQKLTHDPKWPHTAISTLQVPVRAWPGYPRDGLGSVLWPSLIAPPRTLGMPSHTRVDGLQRPQGGCARLQVPQMPTVVETSPAQHSAVFIQMKSLLLKGG